MVDISGADPTQYKTLVRMQSAALPEAGSLDAIVQRGKHCSTAPSGLRAARTTPSARRGRLSDTGWGSCYSCHPQGHTDSVTWMFADGPRQAISMESTFEFGARRDPERRTRAACFASAGTQLVGGPRRGARLHSKRPGRLRRREVSSTGSLKARRVLARSLISPRSRTQAERRHGRHRHLPGAGRSRTDLAGCSSNGNKFGHLKQGRELFEAAGCQNCHGGRNWTISNWTSLHRRRPARSSMRSWSISLSRGHLRSNLFTDGVSNEIRANNNANVQARGNLGFNVPPDFGLRQCALPAQRSGADAGSGARKRDAPEDWAA